MVVQSILSVLFCSVIAFSGKSLASPGCGEPVYEIQENPDVISIDVGIGQVPWMVSLGLDNKEGGYVHQCGGSLITSKHVLTAAHCFDNILEIDPKDRYSVRAGTSFYKDNTNFTVTQRIIEILRHPKYDRYTLHFDAGIAIAEKEIKFSDYIQPICLPTKPVDTSDYLTGDLVTLTGFGKVSSTAVLATELKFINLKVLSAEECTKEFGEDALQKAGIPQINIDDLDKDFFKGFNSEVSCVSNTFKYENACEGDSGSPVIRSFSGTGRDVKVFEQHFIVSKSLDCRLPATAYTRVTNRMILSWIRNITDTHPYLMVIGGYNNGEVLNSVEIVANDPNNNCSSQINPVMPDPSKPDKGKGQGMVGAFTKRAAIICGGAGIDSSKITNECFEYIQRDKRWIEIPSMSLPRLSATSILDNNDNMWVFGGTYGIQKGGDLSELYNYRPNGKGEWTTGKQLPAAFRDTSLQNHCAVRLNGSHIWIGGGFVPPYEIKDPLNVRFEGDPEPPKPKIAGGIVLKKTWFFDGFSWIGAKSMLEERNKAACSLIINQDEEPNILVAGGCKVNCSETDIGLQTAEIYNPKTNNWTKVADLPVPLHSAKMDLLADVPTLVGGFDGKAENDVIYQYDVLNDAWNTYPVKLKVGRSSPALFQVPKSLFENC